MDKMNGKTLNISINNAKIIGELFPQVVTDGKINFEILKLLLGEDIEKVNERYQFSWNGKVSSIKFAQTPSISTLIPSKNNSKNWNTTKNLYIEGDNVEVLKLLQKTYFGKIKMIYIDPPYNTGNDFVYNDDFKNTIENYKVVTNQQNRANPDTNGRFHTNWLNMMYPRLMLAKNLLSDEGVICVSIDDHENFNLRNIMNEIFGEYNFVGEIIRKTKSMTADNNNGFNMQHESLMIYCNNKENIILKGEEKDFNGYSNPDNDPNGPWCSADPSAKSGGNTTYFPITNPYTGKVDYPPVGRYWAFSQKTLMEYVENGRLKFKENHKENERGFIFKRYKKNTLNLFNPLNSLFIHNKYMNQTATTEILNILGGPYFDYPKPVAFLYDLVKSLYGDDFYVLDFFSGSGTTAEAVMKLNSEDSGNRKFIMVQLPELCEENSTAYKNGYKNICEVGEERIRRAGQKIYNELKEKYDNSGLLVGDCINPDDLDFGFKVFKLESTNIKPWDYSHKIDDQTIFDFRDTIKEDRSNLDVAYEIMLKYGIFNMSLEEIQINNKTMYSIGDKFMIICLDNDINENDVIEIANLKPTCVVFKENGFKDDNEKMNATYTLERFGVTDVKCI